MWPVYLATLVLVLPAHGQEMTEEYCRSLKPDFLAPPQSTPSPFIITADKDQYSSGSTITVNITATSAMRFRGFLLQARRADPTKDQNEQIGYFSQIKGTSTGCRGRYGNGLGHSLDEDGYDVLKKHLSVQWSSGTDSQGHIRFRATIITDDETYWVGEKSKIIYDTSAQPMPSEAPESDSNLFSRIDVSQCGKTKGCYRNPKGCTQETCDMLVTWRDRGEFVDFEMTGDSDGWVAVGFSEDKKMGHDDVTECVWNEANSVVEIRQSYNEEGNKKNTLLDPPDLDLHNMEGYMSQGRIRCSFTRLKDIIGRSKKFDLTAKYHILMTRGEADKNGNKEIHVLEPNKYPYVTPSKVSVTRNVDLTSTARYPLVKFHGILMVIAWMLCASTALIMAKYYKPMWPNSGLCRERVWYAVHRGLMLTVLGCTILAFILIFVHVNGYSWMPFYHDKAHPPLGICVTILVVLNPLLNICRCSPKSSYRPIFNWIHWLFGTVAAILAMPTLFIGLNLPKAHVPWWATWVMVVYMLFHLIIELLLEIHGCINARKQKLRDEEYELRKKNDPRGELHGRLPEPVGRRFKKRILTVYLIVTIICTIIMVIAIAIG